MSQSITKPHNIIRHRRAFLIAELGSSPAPEWDLEAWALAGQLAGAHALKIQLWRAEHFPPAYVEAKRPYEFPRPLVSQFKMATYAAGLVAGASVFDDEAIELVGAGLDFFKLAAREHANGPLTRKALAASGRYKKPLYRTVPLGVEPGTLWTAPRVVHFFTLPELYPAPLGAAMLGALRAALTVRRLGYRAWGWSSHTSALLDTKLAVTLGASYVEKHLAITGDEFEAPWSLRVPAMTSLARWLQA